MRGHVPGLDSPHPLGLMLPGIYQGDDFAQRFTGGLDEMLAPVLCTLDNLPAYVDPGTAPEDFLEYVSGWLGVQLEPSWDDAQRRKVIAGAVALHRRRGTAAGVREAVALVLGIPVEVRESGGARWSRRPGAELPGEDRPWLVVRIASAGVSELEKRRIDALVAAVKPAHVEHRIEWGDGPAPTGPGSEAAA